MATDKVGTIGREDVCSASGSASRLWLGGRVASAAWVPA